MATRVSKVCARCKIDQPVSQFNTRGKSRPNDLQSNCKACQRELADKWKAENQDRVKVHNKRADLKRRYGLTLEQYEELCDQAENRCEACGVDEPLCVDHDHETGEVRGMLCNGCNIALGHLSDSPERILMLHAYALEVAA